MKLINSRNNHFQGEVRVGDQNVYINTSDGTGINDVLNMMKPQVKYLICFGKKLNCNLDQEDIEQDIYVTILEGIFKYKKNEKASLSTFLCQIVRNSLIDSSRKAKVRNKMVCVDCFENIEQKFCDPINKIDLNNALNNYDCKWKNIILRIFVNGESISAVAKDEGMSPWGLTRSLRRKLKRKNESIR